MSVARFIADQRTFYRVPVAVCCAILGVSAGWFYKWVKAPVSCQARRAPVAAGWICGMDLRDPDVLGQPSNSHIA